MALPVLIRLLAVLFFSCCAWTQTWAEQDTGSVHVSVSLNPRESPPASSGTCGTRFSGSVLAVGCADGRSAPVQMMAFTPRGGSPLPNSFEVYAGSGAILGWQVLSFNDRDYIEMTLGW